MENIICRIENDLITTFDSLFECFRCREDLLNYIPVNNGWTIGQILEHVSLTNYFLLILIRKGTAKAIDISKKTDYKTKICNYDMDWDKLDAIAKHRSFPWNRPEHMEPVGSLTLVEVRSKLTSQLNECIGYLRQMPNGEGALYKTMMSVNNLGKIDVYHYIYFLAQHAKRHLSQIEKIKFEFEKTTE